MDAAAEGREGGVPGAGGLRRGRAVVSVVQEGLIRSAPRVI